MQFEVSIEVAKSCTKDLLAALHRLIPQLSSSSEPLDESQVQEIIDSDSTVLFVANLGNQIIGVLTLATFRIPTGVRAWIEDVVVDENIRGRGVGEKLTMAAIAEARSSGARTVDLTSRPGRVAANGLYQKLGFVQRTTNVYRFEIT